MLVKTYKESKVTRIDKILAATILRFFPKKVTPNQITITRFFSVPFVAFFIYHEAYAVAIPLFILAAFTDALDGALARTTGRITEWGKIYDPIADKLLIGIAGIIIIPKYLGINLIFAIIALEVFLIGAAYYLKNRGAVEISANGWGKAKMVCQSFGATLLLIYAVVSVPAFLIVSQYLFYFSIVLAVVSLISYGL